MRVLGLDSDQYLNLQGTVRTVVRTHGLDKAETKGMLLNNLVIHTNAS